MEWRLWFHQSVMFLLYLCQGLGQGTLGVVPLLLVQKNTVVGTNTQATLSLPVLCFSVKFLWAPVVDRVYLRHFSLRAVRIPFLGKRTFPNLHRRIQWVFPIQMLLCLAYVLFAISSGSSLILSSSKYLVFQLLLFLFSVGLLCATQDVAVDSWTVEGLPVSRQTSAGSIQLCGLICGISLCGGFIQLIDVYPTVFTLKLFFVSCGAASFSTGMLSLILALTNRISGGFEDDDNSPSFAPRLKEIASSKGVKDVILIHVSRGWAQSCLSLINSYCLQHNLLKVSTLQLFRSCGTLVEIVLTGTVVSKLVKKHHAVNVIRLESSLSLPVNASALVLFILFGSFSSFEYFAILPIMLINSCLSAFLFVSNMTLSSQLALNYPSDLGAVMTLLNAFGNAGNSFPSVFIMYLAGFIGSFSKTIDDRGGLHKNVVIISGGVVLTLAVALRYKVLIPTIKRLLFNEDVMSKF
ncbi:Acetyl-coenzyme A transporter 1, putative [Angomonas deanei]|uniref:Acetyl-coenzyme A transporter 1, putative n=1 Tax=Angomonas deanei TaxID=59799 RepID=A0A7G2CEB0_9TRYP|nr:Acetyl-coenzyme A transporter 1, putative [Angomonas deanei]